MSSSALRGISCRLWKYFLHLLWPVSCEVCGRIGVELCGSCRERMTKAEIPSRGIPSLFTGKIITRHSGKLTVYSAADYHTSIKRVIHNFKYNASDNEWSGEIYNPVEGEMYKAYAKFETAKRLKVRGYVGLPIFGRSMYWIKLD